MSHDTMGEFEHLVLLAVMQLDDDAYGAPIRRLIAERAERDVSFGAVYSTLRRLEAKDYVTFDTRPSTSPVGGRPRRVARATDAGRRAVRAAQRRLRRMAAPIADAVR